MDESILIQKADEQIRKEYNLGSDAEIDGCREPIRTDLVRSFINRILGKGNIYHVPRFLDRSLTRDGKHCYVCVLVDPTGCSYIHNRTRV